MLSFQLWKGSTNLFWMSSVCRKAGWKDLREDWIEHSDPISITLAIRQLSFLFFLWGSGRAQDLSLGYCMQMHTHILQPHACMCILCHFSRVWLFETPMDYSPPGSSVHGILQARILESVAMPSSRGYSQPRDQTHVSYISCIGRCVLYHWRHLGSPCITGRPLFIALHFVVLLRHHFFSF